MQYVYEKKSPKGQRDEEAGARAKLLALSFAGCG